MAEGILAGADALIAQLQLPDEEAQARNAEAARLLAERDRGTGPAGFFWIIVVAVILIVIFSNRGVGRRFRGGRAPGVPWGPGHVIGRAPGGDRVVKVAWVAVGAVALKKK